LSERGEAEPAEPCADAAGGSDALRQCWDQRYHGAVPSPEPAAVLQQWAHLVPSAGAALDCACGLGANALWLARSGLRVCAWDLSPVAIGQLRAEAQRRGLAVQAEVRDLIVQPPAPQSFDLICVVRFLERDLAAQLAAALRPGGLLFYETFTQEVAGGRGPRNPAYRLAPNELLELFRGLVVRGYREEGRRADPDSGLAGLALMVAEKRP
jgi:2-polyprenyl-3-methyl-5-hydroxy-6-metoxy-1,4-benzoquinol methylase